jgi:hypothetical protein
VEYFIVIPKRSILLFKNPDYYELNLSSKTYSLNDPYSEIDILHCGT